MVTQSGIPAQTDKLAIVPGQRIGQVRLHETLHAVEQRLGPSDSGDSALGHYWRTWKAHSAAPHAGTRHDLDVYAIVNEASGHLDIRIIRVTSPVFHTADGIACGSTLVQIRKRYPKAHRVARYLSPQVSKMLVVFDATSQGIAFEVACDKEGQLRPASPCVALLAHAAGKQSIQEEYYRLTTYEVSKPAPTTRPQNPERKR